MKNRNKLIASLLVGSMVLAMAACGDNTDGSSSGNSSNANDGSSTPAESTNQGDNSDNSDNNAPAEVEKPDKITVMWDGTIFKEGENYAEAFYNALSDALGIQVDFTRPDHSSYSDQVGIAFNDVNNLPDVVLLPATSYVTYAAQGNLWNMTDAWLNSETVKRGNLINTAQDIIDMWYTPGPDGVMGIYGMYPARGNGCVTYVRAEWAKNAGYTEDTLPKTWAEYQDFLVAMKDANGGAPLLAPGLLNSGEAPYTNYLPEFYQQAYPEFYVDNNGTWVDGFNSQEMADALDRLAWAYSNGVLEASILESPGTADVRNKFYDGTTGVFTYWENVWAYTIKSNLAKNGLDDEIWIMEPIAELGAYSDRMSPMICITTNCKNPEGVFTYFIDKILDGGEVQMLWMFGVEGVHYVWDDAHEHIIGQPGESTETVTQKNLFEANLKIADFIGFEDPFVPQDEIVNECFEMYNANFVSAHIPLPNYDQNYRDYAATLMDKKVELIAAVTKGEMTGADAVAQYNEEVGAISELILNSLNSN